MNGVLVPFSLRVTGVRRLLLLTLANDPVYADLEIWWVRDGGGAEGMVLLAFRTPAGSSADVYVQQHLDVPRADYEFGAGLSTCTTAAFDPARFGITESGAQVDLGVTLLDGRRLRLRVHEARMRPRPRVRMLAPAGRSMTDPRFFPFFWLHDVWFVRSRSAEVSVEVDGQRQRLVRIGPPFRLMRYAVHPLTGLLCEERHGDVPTVPDQPGPHELSGSVVHVVSGPAISGITAGHEGRELALRFDPPVPDLHALSDGHVRGRFGLWAEQREQLGGGYEIARTGATVQLSLHIDRPWNPGSQPPPAAAVFRVLAVFRTWPTTYRWDATLDFAGRTPVLDSHWSRGPAR